MSDGALGLVASIPFLSDQTRESINARIAEDQVGEYAARTRADNSESFNDSWIPIDSAQASNYRSQYGQLTDDAAAVAAYGLGGPVAAVGTAGLIGAGETAQQQGGINGAMDTLRMLGGAASQVQEASAVTQFAVGVTGTGALPQWNASGNGNSLVPANSSQTSLTVPGTTSMTIPGQAALQGATITPANIANGIVTNGALAQGQTSLPGASATQATIASNVLGPIALPNNTAQPVNTAQPANTAQPVNSSGASNTDARQVDLVKSAIGSDISPDTERAITGAVEEGSAMAQWGTLPDGLNQGIKHYYGYMEQYPDRISGIERRLGVQTGTFDNTPEGFTEFTNQAQNVIRTATANSNAIANTSDATDLSNLYSQLGIDPARGTDPVRTLSTADGGTKTLYYVPGAAKISEGVVVIEKDGVIQSMMASKWKDFNKLK